MGHKVGKWRLYGTSTLPFHGGRRQRPRIVRCLRVKEREMERGRVILMQVWWWEAAGAAERKD